MVDPSNSEPRSGRRFLRQILTRRSLWLSLLASSAVIAGGTWRLWIYIHDELAPQLSQQLEQTLDRPVELGDVERVSLNGIRFGPSTIPTYRYQENDKDIFEADNVSVNGIQVNFNLWQVLVSRRLDLGITLEEPQLTLVEDEEGRWFRTELNLPEGDPGPIDAGLVTIRLQDAQLIIDPYGQTPQRLEQIRGNIEIEADTEQIRANIHGRLGVGGTWRLEADWDQAQTQGRAQVRGKDLNLVILNSFLPETVQVQQGQLDGHVSTPLPIDSGADIQGQLWLRGLGATAEMLPQPLRNVNGQAQFQESLLRVRNLSGSVGRVNWQATGTAHLDQGWNLKAQIAPLDIGQTLSDWGLELPIPVLGQVRVNDIQIRGPLLEPNISGRITNANRMQLDRLEVETLDVAFQGDTSQLTIPSLLIQPRAGGEIRGEARLDAMGELMGNVRLTGIPADAIARSYDLAAPITLGTVAAQLELSGFIAQPETLQGRLDFQAPQAQYPTVGTIVFDQERLLLQQLDSQLLGGRVRGQGQVVAGRWQLNLNAEDVALRQFNPDLPGQLQGQFRATGFVDEFSAAATLATAQIQLVNTPLADPVNARLQWDGQTLRLQEGRAGAILARGTIGLNFDDLTIAGVNLTLQADELPLTSLPLPELPIPVALAGTSNFQGQLTGNLGDLQFTGQLGLTNFGINDFDFAQNLAGTVSLSQTQGVELALAGQGDRLQVVLDANFEPERFLIQRDQAIARGQRQGEDLRIQVAQFPLESLEVRLPNLPKYAIPAGMATADALLNWRTPTLRGTLLVEEPGLGNWRGDRLQAAFNYADGAFNLTSSELTKDESRYQLTARLQPDRGLSRAQLVIDNGELNDVVALGNLLGLPGLDPPVYGTAADLDLVPVGIPQAPLLSQIRRFSEVQLLQAEAIAAAEEVRLPRWQDLNGQFNGQITLMNHPGTGLVTSFELQGQSWQWGRYPIERVITSGRFGDRTLTLNTFQIDAGGGTIQAEGRIGQTHSARLAIDDFSLGTLRSLIPFPDVDLEGNLDLRATLTGALGRPQFEGQLALQDGTLNTHPVREANATFSYGQDRVAFQGQALFDSPDPVTVSGSFPYQAPFSPGPLQDDSLLLTMQVKDQGLGLVNLLTDEVKWVDGQGELQVQVQGTLGQPLVEGILSIDQATLSTPALDAPLTDVSARIRFDRDRIRVEGVQGQFSSGQIEMAGVLPLAIALSSDDPDRDTPLTLSLNQIRLQAKEVYTGDVNGTILITDSLRSPDISGTVRLSQGQFDLGIALAGNGTVPALNGNGNRNGNGLFQPPEFDGFQILLGQNVNITRAPVLNLTAEGSLTLNGTLRTLQPEGEIRLTRGQLNLFTSLFVLMPNRPNTVRFNPAFGLDPELNLNLVTTVTEVFTTGTNRLNEFGDVTATSLGSLNTIRVVAQVEGRASQFQTNLPAAIELSSSPPRSNAEILSLLGGGFNPLQNQASGELILANLATSALFNNVQAALDNLVGSQTSFRIFPALVPPNRGDREESPVLAVGAELGFQVTDRFSISALQLLTAPQTSTRLNLGYQFTEHFGVSTQLGADGQSLGLFEYRRRF
ncbi:translocation/assembly module TamB domain-containing protein [Candidatus Synechococcus calcipolaris G9]|uniref:Translocation/assembly module TamB domain-containing protein n=1 Tax=Candidatus Synechococcus calcipolaris G9 TaxID=1497997 RepID=A0ABT6F050_9SYNE|nr:translocation/assembly module TamB domain-containing protein [Candidatus Synechococcus calcipolaris]MDG2991215.1 translocation/assembly module TamB domain-containing protein [Candidatus Synechococcus calcipolaris G9]